MVEEEETQEEDEEEAQQQEETKGMFEPSPPTPPKHDTKVTSTRLTCVSAV